MGLGTLMIDRKPQSDMRLDGNQHGSLDGRISIVTGASRGLGLKIAQAIWHKGGSLLLVARSKELLIQLQSSLELSARKGQEVHIVAADLQEPNAVRLIMNETERVFRKVDVLVNNAAILGPVGRVWENDWNLWQTAIRVNLLAPVELCKACASLMKNRREGKIINISGGGATGPRPNFSAYASSKVALVRFSETLAMELKEFNVQVNAIAPGAMVTEMTTAVIELGPEKAGEKEYATAVQLRDAGRGDVDRAVELCIFLSSSLSDGITGKIISAVWDPWEKLQDYAEDLNESDIYTLRRIIPKDRNRSWG
jgi:short-subunit dehydrogenase